MVLQVSTAAKAVLGDGNADLVDGKRATHDVGHAFRDLLVHLDGTAHDGPILAHAEMIAMLFGAHVRGVLTREIPSSFLTAGMGVEGIAVDFWPVDEETKKAQEDAARCRLALLEPTTDLVCADGMRHELSTAIASLARSVDLVVMGRPYGGSSGSADLMEAVLFDARVPTLLIPPEALKAERIDSIVVGWRDSTECARAISAALPLLKKASRVYLVAVSDGSAARARRDASDADMARHLSRHGIHAELRHVPHWDRASAGLLNEAVTVGADLIVSGAYGRSRIREFILGGMTRDLLEQCPIPLLMAH